VHSVHDGGRDVQVLIYHLLEDLTFFLCPTRYLIERVACIFCRRRKHRMLRQLWQLFHRSVHLIYHVRTETILRRIPIRRLLLYSVEGRGLNRSNPQILSLLNLLISLLHLFLRIFLIGLLSLREFCLFVRIFCLLRITRNLFLSELHIVGTCFLHNVFCEQNLSLIFHLHCFFHLFLVRLFF